MGSFRHEPLDYGAKSIRLLYFYTEEHSPSIIQCTMRHATIEARYTCLSYRWGDDVATNRILVNGKELYVRRNLFDFLKNAVKKEWQEKVQRVCAEHHEQGPFFTERWYWIDALCIDQNNNTEKNHQVRMMGEVFESAEQVFVWLGTTENDRLLSESLSGLAEVYPGSTHGLFDNEYWCRAWVTQEIVLARFAVLLANKEAKELQSFMSRVKNTWENLNNFTPDNLSPYWIKRTPFWQFTNNLSGIRYASLLELLILFKDRKCSIARDRIYSLLSVCRHGSHVKADYKILDEEVMFQTLAGSGDQLCLCSAMNLARLLELQKSPPSRSYRGLARQPYLEIDVHAQLDQPDSWCVLHHQWYMGPPMYLGKGPGMVFNARKTCPKRNMPCLYWRRPRSPYDKQTVWLDPSNMPPHVDLIPLCQYGEGFSVIKKYRSHSTAHIRTQRRPLQHANNAADSENVYNIRREFERRRAPDMKQAVYNEEGILISPSTIDEQYEYMQSLDIYTLRMSFEVLAKLATTDYWYTGHCKFEREECSSNGFEYARIGYGYCTDT